MFKAATNADYTGTLLRMSQREKHLCIILFWKTIKYIIVLSYLKTYVLFAYYYFFGRNNAEINKALLVFFFRLFYCILMFTVFFLYWDSLLFTISFIIIYWPFRHIFFFYCKNKYLYGKKVNFISCLQVTILTYFFTLWNISKQLEKHCMRAQSVYCFKVFNKCPDFWFWDY